MVSHFEQSPKALSKSHELQQLCDYGIQFQETLTIYL